MDVLGVMVAFCVVMLTLSLLVTAINQIIQHVFRLRGRNLQYGVASIVEGVGAANQQESKTLARKILNQSSIDPLKRTLNPESNTWVGSPVSWIEVDQFAKALEPAAAEEADPSDGAQAKLDGGSQAKLVEAFKNAERPLSRRFAVQMRYISIVSSLIIAFVFQVSTPALLQELSTDPEKREQLTSYAPMVLEYAEAELQRQGALRPVHQQALAEMSVRYPELATTFSQLDVNAPWWGELSQEMAMAIEFREDVGRITGEFEALALNLTQARIRDASSGARATNAHLGTINITPFRLGRDFYQHACDSGTGYCDLRWRNIVGVFMTVVLLTFGAPFWFNVLKNLMSLRDMLAPEPSPRFGRNARQNANEQAKENDGDKK